MESAGAAGIKRGLGWDSLFTGLGLVILAGFLFYYYSEYTCLLYTSRRHCSRVGVTFLL